MAEVADCLKGVAISKKLEAHVIIFFIYYICMYVAFIHFVREFFIAYIGFSSFILNQLGHGDKIKDVSWFHI